jgi:hypothetical protein
MDYVLEKIYFGVLVLSLIGIVLLGILLPNKPTSPTWSQLPNKHIIEMFVDSSEFTILGDSIKVLIYKELESYEVRNTTP